MEISTSVLLTTAIMHLPSISNSRSHLRTATFRDTTIVFGGNIFSSILGAAFFFLLAHRIGPEGFGTYSAVMAIATVSVDLFDIAINNAIVSFGSKKETASSVFRQGLIQKVLYSSGAVVLLLLFGRLVTSLLGKPMLFDPLLVALWYIPSKALFSFIKTVLQTKRSFFTDAVIETSAATIRLLGFLLIPVASADTLALSLWVTSGSLVISSCIGLPNLLPVLAKRGPQHEQVHFSQFQRWMTLAFVGTAIGGKLDVFFLTRFASLDVVGWYQAAFRLLLPVQQLASSLSRVFAPRFAMFGNRREAGIYLRKTLWFSGLLSLAMLLTIPLFPFAIPILYGPTFGPTIPLGIALLGYTMIFLFSTPWWSSILYYFRDAKTFSYLSLLQLPLLTTFLVLLVPPFGAMGAVIALTMANEIEPVLEARRGSI